MYNVYLSGEIHTDWRNEIKELSKQKKLEVNFFSPELNHEFSDKCGVSILGEETKKFWADHKSSKINFIRTKKLINLSDLVVVKFGEKYKQWNAAFEAGMSVALNKSLIVIHDDNVQHALKEVDSSALAVVKDSKQLVNILDYVLNGKL